MIELGAGTGIVGILAALQGASALRRRGQEGQGRGEIVLPGSLRAGNGLGPAQSLLFNKVFLFFFVLTASDWLSKHPGWLIWGQEIKIGLALVGVFPIF